MLGDSKVISFIAWKIFQWSRRATSAIPDHEKFIIEANKREEEYWARFEKSVKVLKKVSNYYQVPVLILLAPNKDWLIRYEYSGEYNDQQKRYEELFAKYQIPFEDTLDEFAKLKAETGNEMFWSDDHPNHMGSEAMARSLDTLLKRSIK